MATAEATDVNVSAFPYEFKVVEIAKMMVDSSYQRPLTSFKDKIVNNFDPALVGTLVLSHRADTEKYAVVDGQTRMAGMRELRMPSAPAVVFYGLSRAQEAQLFAKLQKERRGIASYHRFRAALVGGDPEAAAISRICEEAGYEIGIGNDKISAVAGLESVYRRSPELLERALVILRSAWTDRHMPNGEVLRGLGYLLQKEKIEDDRMAQKLGIVSQDELRRRASALREGGGSGGNSVRYMAGALEGVYRRRG